MSYSSRRQFLEGMRLEARARERSGSSADRHASHHSTEEESPVGSEKVNGVVSPPGPDLDVIKEEAHTPYRTTTRDHDVPRDSSHPRLVRSFLDDVDAEDDDQPSSPPPNFLGHKGSPTPDDGVVPSTTDTTTASNGGEAYENSQSDTLPTRLRSNTIPYADRLQMLESEKKEREKQEASRPAAPETVTTTSTLLVVDGEEPPEEQIYTARPQYDRPTPTTEENPLPSASTDASKRLHLHTQEKEEQTLRRDREGSAARREEDLRDLQIQLATEKAANIEAEKKIIFLNREVDVLKKENLSLASSAAPSLSASLNHATTAHSHSPKYVEELEQRVSQLSKLLEQKEERIRLLEQRLADELINRGPSSSQPPAEVAAAPTPTVSSSTVPLTRISSHPSPSRSVEVRTTELREVPSTPTRRHSEGRPEKKPDRLRRRAGSEAISPQRAAPSSRRPSTHTTTTTTTTTKNNSVVSSARRPSSARRQSTKSTASASASTSAASPARSSLPRHSTQVQRQSHPVSLSKQRSGSTLSQSTSSLPPHNSYSSSALSTQRTSSVHRTAVSPTRSVASHASASTRARPQITYGDDTVTMKGTTTTVVFRSKSPQQYTL